MYSPVAVHVEHAMLQLAFVGSCCQDSSSVRRAAGNIFSVMVFTHPNILEIGNASTYPRVPGDQTIGISRASCLLKTLEFCGIIDHPIVKEPTIKVSAISVPDFGDHILPIIEKRITIRRVTHSAAWREIRVPHV